MLTLDAHISALSRLCKLAQTRGYPVAYAGINNYGYDISKNGTTYTLHLKRRDGYNVSFVGLTYELHEANIMNLPILPLGEGGIY